MKLSIWRTQGDPILHVKISQLPNWSVKTICCTQHIRHAKLWTLRVIRRRIPCHTDIVSAKNSQSQFDDVDRESREHLDSTSQLVDPGHQFYLIQSFIVLLLCLSLLLDDSCDDLSSHCGFKSASKSMLTPNLLEFETTVITDCSL